MEDNMMGQETAQEAAEELKAPEPGQEKPQATRRLSWQEIMEDEEYRRAYMKERQQERLQEARAHLERLRSQAAELNFDLERELENRDFVRLTAPGSALSLEEAYYTVHRKQREESLARESLRLAGESIRSGYDRPRELRGGRPAARSLSDPRAMSRQEREELRRRIYEAGARGEKLIPGNEL